MPVAETHRRGACQAEPPRPAAALARPVVGNDARLAAQLCRPGPGRGTSSASQSTHTLRTIFKDALEIVGEGNAVWLWRVAHIQKRPACGGQCREPRSHVTAAVELSKTVEPGL